MDEDTKRKLKQKLELAYMVVKENIPKVELVPE